MKKIRSDNTKPEIELRKALWSLGYRYRINVSNLKGKPDIFLRKYKIIIFVDGEFWHGFNWLEKKKRIKANKKYWIQKIEKNIARDLETNRFYETSGFKVLRFWEQEIKKNLSGCIKKIVDAIKRRNKN